MSTDFDNAFRVLLTYEGGYSNLTVDHGGATNLGISLRFLKMLPVEEADVTGDGHVDIEDIKALDHEKAAGFYRRHFWEHYDLSRVFHHDIKTKLFGLFVNMRGRVAGRVAQRACRACGYPLTEDGILGVKSISTINTISHRQLLAALRSEQAGVYRVIIAKDATQEVFRDGWINRAYGPV